MKVIAAVALSEKIKIQMEDGKFFMIDPPTEAKNKEPKIKDGQVWVGHYRLNTEDGTWEKISKILSFLKGIVDLIKNIFQ